ncbi:molybdopterin-dependent oxidoreductase [Bacteroidota bacterium]
MEKTDSKRAICEFCHSRCRVVVHSKDGVLQEIEEDRSDPRVDWVFPPTRACLRLNAARDWFYHPDRVNFPLKRIGQRGEGKWNRISWEQAFDEIAAKLQAIKAEHGAESIALTTGTARTREEYVSRFANLLGTPNIGGEAMICFGPRIVTSQAVFGWAAYRPTIALKEGTKCFFLIGIDPSQSRQREWKDIRDCKQAGIKIIVADPRRTATAELADIWLQLRPGSDTALLMSMINVIIEEGLYDKDFVDKWCYGFDRLAKRAREYPPEKVAATTWLAPEQIIEAARMYGSNRPGVSLNGMGSEHLANAIEAIHARIILTAITGSIDVKGGQLITGPASCITEGEIALTDALSPEQKAKQLGADRFKLLSWPGYDLLQSYTTKVWGKPCAKPNEQAQAHPPTMYRSMISGVPYPVKACITVASNPLISAANTKLVYNALKSLELYVVLDYWLTPSAELADYVLAPASWLERPFFNTGGGGIDNSIIAGEQALPTTISGKYDHRTDYEILRELMIRLGYGEYWPWKTLEDSYDYRLEPMGITFKQFMAQGGYHIPPPEYKKYEEVGFATPTGKVELYSTIFEKLGYDPLPRYEEPFENPVSTPKVAKMYPLILITGGRFHPMYHSEHRQIKSLRRRHPYPLIQIHPETARKNGIDNGDWVWIETLRGQIMMRCQYFDGMDARVVHAEHDWWLPELPGEEPSLHGVWRVNVNVLTDDNPDICNKLSGGWPLKTALCKIRKVQECELDKEGLHIVQLKHSPA